MKKDKEKKDEAVEKEMEPIAVLRNNKGEFIAYIYEEDFFDADIDMSDYYVERLK